MIEKEVERLQGKKKTEEVKSGKWRGSMALSHRHVFWRMDDIILVGEERGGERLFL